MYGRPAAAPPDRLRLCGGRSDCDGGACVVVEAAAARGLGSNAPVRPVVGRLCAVSEVSEVAGLVGVGAELGLRLFGGFETARCLRRGRVVMVLLESEEKRCGVLGTPSWTQSTS